MELKVTTLDGKAAGSVDLSDTIFGLEPRADILQRCVTWQRVNGTSATCTSSRNRVTRSDVREAASVCALPVAAPAIGISGVSEFLMNVVGVGVSRSTSSNVSCPRFTRTRSRSVEHVRMFQTN